MANIAAGVVDAVVNAGWWVANANRVRDIVNRGMDIAEDRSKDCIKIFQNAVDSMLQKGVEIVGEWNYVTKCAGISALAVCVNHLVNKLSDANCEEDYFAPKCFVKNSINVVATVIASVSLINMLMGKRTTDLNIDRSHSRQSSSEATVAGIGASGVDIKEIKLCGVKNNKPYFLVHKLFDKRKCIETQGSLKIRISLEARSFLLETPGLQLSEDTFFPHLTSVEVEDESIAQVTIEREGIQVTPKDSDDNLKISLVKLFYYEKTLLSSPKLDCLELIIHSEKKSKETKVKIVRGKDNLMLSFNIAKIKDNLRVVRSEIQKRSKEMSMLKVSREVNGEQLEELVESSLRDVLIRKND